MSQQELDDATQNIVVHQFALACTMASALNRGRDKKELEKYIMQESIKELEFFLKKKNEPKNVFVNNLFQIMLIGEKFSFFLPRFIEKKMSECEEIEACHKFISEIVSFIPPFCQRKFVLVGDSVSSDEFVIKVNYDKEQFEHLTNEFVRDITKEAQNSRLHRYNWAVHRPLVQEIVDPSSFFLHSVVITFTGN